MNRSEMPMKPAVVVLLLVFALSTVLVTVVASVLAIPPGEGNPDLECRLIQDHEIDCWNTANCRLAEVVNGHFSKWSGLDKNNDSDGWWKVCGPDCNDTDATVNPGKVESTSSSNCNDGKDNDCDGLRDSDDYDCSVPPSVTLSVNVTGTNVTLFATTNYPMTCRWSEGPSSYNTLKDNDPENSLMVFNQSTLKTHTKVLTNVPAGTHTYYAYCRMPP